MTNHDLRDVKEKFRGASVPHETLYASPSSEIDASVDAPVDASSDENITASENITTSVEQTLQLGEQLMGFAAGVVDLARTEISLAVRTLPNLLMIWVIMMPIMLLTWGAFTVLVAWIVYDASQHTGLGLLVFFLQQVLLLVACRWLYLRYSVRMTLPYTRAHIVDFVRGMQNGPDGRSEAKK